MSALVRPLAWFYHEFGLVSIQASGRNAYLIILSRSCRMVAHGAVSLILAIFFSALDFSDHQIGLFMTLTLLGDVFLGTTLTLVADRVGRRRVLLGGSLLMVFSGLVFAVFENFWVLLCGAIVGVISVTGGDFGPFRSIEESVLSQLTTSATRADVLSWYVAISTLGSSIGSEAAGRFIRHLQEGRKLSPVDAYHTLFWLYAGMGLVNLVLVSLLSPACELTGPADEAYAQLPQQQNDEGEEEEEEGEEDADDDDNNKNNAAGAGTGASPRWRGRWLTSRLSQISKPTRAVMWKLWVLLALDSVADGMVPYSLTNYFVDEKFHPSKSTLGDVLSASFFLGAVSSTFAGPLARKIGLVNTMVFTHVPSSAAVLLFPFPGAFWATAGLLLLRSALNPLDQAPRTALIAAVVRADERTAVMGVTALVRTTAAMLGPTLTGLLAADGRFWIAFVAAGAARLAYDFGLYALFVNVQLHQHEAAPGGPRPGPRDEEQQPLELRRVSGSSARSGEPRETKSKPEEEASARSGALQLPVVPGGRARSRSPHRSSVLDT